MDNARIERGGLAPYYHELNREGTACADDCPACRWAREHFALMSDSKFGGLCHVNSLLTREEYAEYLRLKITDIERGNNATN